MMDKDDVIDTLNDLIETSKDGEYGFNECAEHAQAGQLKALFNNRALECRAAALELQQIVAASGGEPDTSGTVSGALSPFPLSRIATGVSSSMTSPKTYSPGTIFALGVLSVNSTSVMSFPASPRYFSIYGRAMGAYCFAAWSGLTPGGSCPLFLMTSAGSVGIDL